MPRQHNENRAITGWGIGKVTRSGVTTLTTSGSFIVYCYLQAGAVTTRKGRGEKSRINSTETPTTPFLEAVEMQSYDIQNLGLLSAYPAWVYCSFTRKTASTPNKLAFFRAASRAVVGSARSRKRGPQVRKAVSHILRYYGNRTGQKPLSDIPVRSVSLKTAHFKLDAVLPDYTDRNKALPSVC